MAASPKTSRRFLMGGGRVRVERGSGLSGRAKFDSRFACRNASCQACKAGGAFRNALS